MAEKSLEEYSAEEIAAMAGTYNALVNNPATRETILRATKHINPNISIPEVEIKDAGRAAFADVNKRMDEMQTAQLQRDAAARIERERAGLRESGMSADDIAAVEKIMTDEQIPSYATAAKYYRNSRELAEATPNKGAEPVSTTYELPTEAMAANKGGKQGLAKFARSQADTALAELRSGRVKLQ